MPAWLYQLLFRKQDLTILRNILCMTAHDGTEVMQSSNGSRMGPEWVQLFLPICVKIVWGHLESFLSSPNSHSHFIPPLHFKTKEQFRFSFWMASEICKIISSAFCWWVSDVSLLGQSRFSQVMRVMMSSLNKH